MSQKFDVFYILFNRLVNLITKDPLILFLNIPEYIEGMTRCYDSKELKYTKRNIKNIYPFMLITNNF